MTSSSEALLHLLLKEYINMIISGSVIISFGRGDGADSFLDEKDPKRHAGDRDDEIDDLELDIIALMSIQQKRGYDDGDDLSSPRKKDQRKKRPFYFSLIR